MTQSIPLITIDGPSGTGKSTVCSRLAAELGWHLLDSGALYRALTYAASVRAIQYSDTAKLSALAQVLNVCFTATDKNATVAVMLDGEDVSDKLRSEECGNNASQIAVIPQVRAALLDHQRAFLRAPGLIADGRDMGTVVFPTAPVKIYLTATAERRATRRYQQLQERRHKHLKKKEIGVNLRQVLFDIEDRDARDKQRKIAPLKPADDALLIDTTDLAVAAVVTLILAQVKRVLPKPAE